MEQVILSGRSQTLTSPYRCVGHFALGILELPPWEEPAESVDLFWSAYSVDSKTHIQLPAEGRELVVLEELRQDFLNELSDCQHEDT